MLRAALRPARALKAVAPVRAFASTSSSASASPASASSASARWPVATPKQAVDPTTFVAAQQQLRSWPQAKVTTLPNGVRVATESTGGSSAQIGVYIDAGSRHNADERQSGLANFAQRALAPHLRPLSNNLHAKGGSFTASTGRETTAYTARVSAKDTPLAVQFLSDVVMNRDSINDERVQATREHVVREMEVVDNDYEEATYDRLHETAFRGTPLARPILGSVDNVKQFTVKEVKNFLSDYYTGSRVVIAGSGDVEHSKLVELATQHFGALPKDSAAPATETALFTGSELRIRHDLVPKAHAAIAFAIAGHQDPDTHALQVMQHMLGSWERRGAAGIHHSSYMIRQVAREELAEKLHTFIAPYSDIGLFGVYTSMDWLGQHQLFRNILYSITDLSYNADQLELIEGQRQLVVNTLLRLESPSNVNEDLGRNILNYGRRIHPVETLTRISDVNMDTVRSVAQRYLLDRDPAFGAIGPIWELPDYAWLRARTYSRKL